MKEIFHWVQNRHHEPVFLSVQIGKLFRSFLIFSSGYNGKFYQDFDTLVMFLSRQIYELRSYEVQANRPR